MNIQEILKEMKKDILRIANQFGGYNIRIFGSVAREETTTTSDIDILIDLEKGRSLLDLIAIKQDLEDLLGCSVDVATDKCLSPYIREAVLREAVSI